MEKKYFFFDIDGTLTDRSTGQIVPSAAEAVRKLKEAGHFVSIATGRARYKAERFRRENGFDHMVCNGGHGIVYQGELRENRPLDYEKALTYTGRRWSWDTACMWRWMIRTRCMAAVSGSMTRRE